MPPKKRKIGGGEEKTRKKKRTKKPRDTSDECDEFSSFSDDNEHQGIVTPIEPGIAGNEGNAVLDAAVDGDGKVVVQLDSVSGELLISGGTNWDMIGRKQAPKTISTTNTGRNLYGPHRLAAFKNINVRTISSGCMACHSVIITSEGKVHSWGRNDFGQLGLGDKNRRDVPSQIQAFGNVNVVRVACGKSHTLFLNDTGLVFATGCNSSGQLGLGAVTPQVILYPTKVQHKGPPIQMIGCGAEFSAIVDIKGNLYTFGSPEYGQLGHNSDGKYFVSSSKIGFDFKTRPQRVLVFVDKSRDGQITPLHDIEIIAIACGQNHMLALDKKERVYTWGFGGYGRLGHTDNKDEMMPRLLKFFEGQNRGAVAIAAGSTYSMAISKSGILYLWGQTRNTGEAAMYPKPVHDLSGWNIRSIGCCYKSIVIAADSSLVSWGCSPTYGELCLGDNAQKSTSTPMESKPLENIYIEKVACGWGHTLLIARNSSDEDKAMLEALPVFNFGS